MLTEGHKIDLLRRGREAQKKIAREQNIKRAIKAGGVALSYYLAPKAAKIKQHMINKDIERREKKMAKNARNVEEAIDVQAVLKRAQQINTAIKNHPVLKVPSVAAKKGMAKAGKWAKENPIKAMALGTAGSVLGKAGTDVAAHYIAHKAKMKDPNYAEMTHHNAEMQRIRKQGGFQHASSPMTRETIQKGAKGAHKPEHAHVAVTRSMAQDKVVTAGAAGKKFARQDVKNKTNTRPQTSDVHALDNIIERCADNVYMMESFGAPAVKAAMGHAKNMAGTAIRKTKTWLGRNKGNVVKAAVKAGRVTAQKGLDYAVGKYQIHKMKKSVSECMSERSQELYELAPVLAAAAPVVARFAVKKGLQMAAGYAAKKAGSAVVNKIRKKSPQVADIQAPGEHLTELTATQFRLIRAGSNAAKAAAVAGGVHLARKGLKKVFGRKKPTKRIETKVWEGVAPGAASPYSLTREKDPKNFYHANRDSHLGSGAEKLARARAKINRGNTQQRVEDIIQEFGPRRDPYKKPPFAKDEINRDHRGRPITYKNPFSKDEINRDHKGRPVAGQWKKVARYARVENAIHEVVAQRDRSYKNSPYYKGGPKRDTSYKNSPFVKHMREGTMTSPKVRPRPSGPIEKRVLQHVGRGLKAAHKWVNTGSNEARRRKKVGVAAGAVATAAAIRARRGNKKYQTARAAHHEKRLGQAEANLDYIAAKKSAKQALHRARNEAIEEESRSERILRQKKKEEDRRKAAAYLEKRRKERKEKNKDDD